MIDFIKRLFGENWKTTLLGVGVFLFATVKCLLAGGAFLECVTSGWNAAFAIGGASLALGAQASRFK